MTIKEIDEAQMNESFSKWLINYEISAFADLGKLVEFELSTFDTWREDFLSKEKELLKAQEELKNKTNLTFDEQVLLQMDSSDLISSDDEDYISFEEEVLQMLLIKIYSKFEIAIKNMYCQKTCRSLPEKFAEWKKKYKNDLSIDFESIPGYIEVQTLRIYNNNFKHSGSILNDITAGEIFDKHLTDTIKDCISDTMYTNLLGVTSKNNFIKRLTLNTIKLNLSKDKIINLHTQAKIFLKIIYEEMYN